MKTRKFTRHDLNSINRWLAKRKLAKVKLSDLPKTGFIVPGVAAGFLRDCEGDLSIMDSLVTNPHASVETRHRALEAVFETIKMYGGRQILGFTTDDGTLTRAKQHGFRQLPHTCLLFVKE